MYFNSRPGIFPSYEYHSSIVRVRNRIVAGANHVLVLMPNGKLYSTGVYNNGNLGRTSQDSRLLYNNPVEVLDELEILQIEAQRNSSMVLTTNGLYVFGLNDRSQLATGGTKSVLKATKVRGFNFDTKIVQIAMGNYASYAIDENGKLWAWGANDQGQIGDRTWDEKNRPFSVYRYGALANQTVVRVCAGNGSVLALTSTGNLVAIGDNTYGQLGTGDYVSSGEPVIVKMKPFQNETIKEIQCGMFHNLVLTASGKVFAFGGNMYGQVGTGNTTNIPIPTLISGINCTVTKIHTKGHVSFAVCASKPGYFYSWGLNDIGQAGVGLSYGFKILSPTLVKYSAHPIVDITSNVDNSFLFLADGSIHATGGCFNTQFFFGQDCFDASPKYFSETVLTKKYAFSINGLFTQVRHQTNMQLHWYQRKPVYFEMGDIAYLLQTENTLPTRRNNGFNMYTTNVTANDMVWKMVEYNETTNTGFPHSIYNTHVLKHGEYVYLFGGVVDDDISNRIYRAPVYDLVQSWELINEKLPIPIASGMLMAVGDYVYIFGGIISIYEFNATADIAPTMKHNVTNCIMRASTTSITKWEIVQDVIPLPLHSAFIEVVDNYVYLFGGSSTVRGSGINIFRATLQYPTVWEMTFGLLPYYVTNTGPFSSTEDKLYIFGGTNSSTSSTGPYFAFGKKNDIIGSWTAIPDTNIELNIIHNATQFDWCTKYPLLCYQCSNPDYFFSAVTGHTGPQYYEATNPSVCSSAGICVGNDGCKCTPGRFGDRCQFTGIVAYNNGRQYADGNVAESCAAYKNPTNTSRVYQGIIGDGFYIIQIIGTTTPIKVYCDMTTNGGGWIAYYTGSANKPVHLAKGYQNPGEDVNSGDYIVDLRSFFFTQVMFSKGGQSDWFTCIECGNGYTVGYSNDGALTSNSLGSWRAGGAVTGTYQLYIADNAPAYAGTTNSAAFMMYYSTSSYTLNPTSGYDTTSYTITGYRTDTGGKITRTSVGGSSIYNECFGVCFRANLGGSCGAGSMTVYLR